MPELPDVSLYLECLAPRVLGRPIEKIRKRSPFLVRTWDPPLASAEGREVVGLRRIGKRVVLGLAGDLHLVFHLMIAGRFRWRKRGAGLPGKIGLAAFDFPDGTLLLTEAGSKKRASLHVVASEAALSEFDPGGIEPLEATIGEFGRAIRRENHTLKRTLTDPRILAGIGNAYSDEILHRAGLSPLLLSQKLADGEVATLHGATQETLRLWIDRLRDEAGDDFPEKVTAFRPEMAVHGKYGEPCPDCGSPVQRIRYAENETNYCATCQTGGRLLKDRSLSLLLKKDWPRTLEELEELRRPPG